MAWVDVEVTGDEELSAQLLQLEGLLSGPGIATALETIIKPWQRRKIESRFAGEEDPTGKSWTPLSEAAQAERVDEGYGAEHPILKRTGDLMEYVVEGGVRTLGLGAQISWPGVGGGNEVQEKYVVNQAGTMDGRHHFGWRVPARPMLGFVPQDLAEAMALLEGWVWGALR